MKRVKWAMGSRAHIRTISAADFRSVGVEDQERVSWDETNDFTAEVSDAAAEYLVAKEVGFQEVSEPSMALKNPSIKKA